ncbi:MAG TPA: GYD domain-containing protein [Gaiellaceae bacterium]|nr:GYD domain-containing protein [Gaiellaceae bacterium]
MPIFILLSTLTQQGIQTLKSNPERLRQVNHDVEELGCKILHQWATLGEFDFVNIVEAPDTATVAKVSVALGARGSTKIETLPALDIEDFLRALD